MCPPPVQRAGRAGALPRPHTTPAGLGVTPPCRSHVLATSHDCVQPEGADHETDAADQRPPRRSTPADRLPLIGCSCRVDFDIAAVVFPNSALRPPFLRADRVTSNSGKRTEGTGRDT